MRVLLRVVLTVFGMLALAFFLCLYWVFFYSRDLPDLDALAKFSPSATSTVIDNCYSAPIIAIPYDAIGPNLRGALKAVEASETGPTAYQQIARELSDVRETSGALSVKVAGTVFCSPQKSLVRQEKELRTAVQLDRRFSRRELFTIAANRYYFGDDMVGVRTAAQYFFHKDPRDLSVSDAALLAGLVRAPVYYSPVSHPDRALKRRNEVLDAMASHSAISTEEAETAKSAPLGVAIR